MPRDWRKLKIENICWLPVEEHIEKYIKGHKKKEVKVIFNNPATILYINGKKYVSKAHEEQFDEEKGLLMCLAKANGVSHLKLQRMIKGAKRVKPKE